MHDSGPYLVPRVARFGLSNFFEVRRSVSPGIICLFFVSVQDEDVTVRDEACFVRVPPFGQVCHPAPTRQAFVAPLSVHPCHTPVESMKWSSSLSCTHALVPSVLHHLCGARRSKACRQTARKTASLSLELYAFAKSQLHEHSFVVFVQSSDCSNHRSSAISLSP